MKIKKKKIPYRLFKEHKKQYTHVYYMYMYNLPATVMEEQFIAIPTELTALQQYIVLSFGWALKILIVPLLYIE